MADFFANLLGKDRNKEKTENKEKSESKEKDKKNNDKDNKYNKDNGDNRDNKANRDNGDNKDNRANKDNGDNKETKDNRANKDTVDNKDNKDHKNIEKEVDKEKSRDKKRELNEKKEEPADKNHNTEHNNDKIVGKPQRYSFNSSSKSSSSWRNSADANIIENITVESLRHRMNDKLEKIQLQRPPILHVSQKPRVSCRKIFDYDILVDLQWWPDEILIFLEILRLGYTDFISAFTANGDQYDGPLRSAIHFMNEKKYNQMEDIKKFLNTPSFSIRENYLNSMINEDNCYMAEVDLIVRSNNENKHFLLVKALEVLLALGQIAEGDIVLKKEKEELVRSYVCIYHLRRFYAMIDITLRRAVLASIDGDEHNLDLINFIKGTLEDLDSKIICHFKEKYIKDEKLFNKVYLFRDLLLYIQYNMIQFKFVFTTSRDVESQILDYDNPSLEMLSPFGKAYENIFSPSVITRIQYVYKYFLSIYYGKQKKTKIIFKHKEFSKMMAETESIKPLLIPRYIIKTMKQESSGDLRNTFIIDLYLEQTISKPLPSRHGRKISVESVISPRKPRPNNEMKTHHSSSKIEELEQNGS